MRTPTLRARLTLIQGGLFLVAGVALLAVTHLLFTWQLERGSRVVARTDGDSRVFAVSGEDAVPADTELQRWMREQQAELQAAASTSLLAQGTVALGAVGVAAAGCAWLASGRVLRPLRRVTETARRIAASPGTHHGLRVGLRGPVDEVKELADAFDSMVERLDRSLDGQRRFVANASHELRTPLTLGRSLVELAMRRAPASDDVRALGARLLAINDRHERLIAGLLLLARSDDEVGERFPVDLADLVVHVVAQTAAEARAAGVTVRTDPGPAATTGDALLLERLVHNLVENGIRHNSGPGGTVDVTTRGRPDRVEVTVSSTGPLLRSAEVPALFEPFHRGRAAHGSQRSAGLGLSIVRSVAHAHGGTAAAEPAPGGGLVVTVALPVDPGSPSRAAARR